MTIDIPGKKIFAQRDVRETPAATATATSVGLTDLNYVLLSTDADTTNERVLTMGEGLDMTDAGPGLTITINGENASDTNKGISKYQLTDFTVTSGDVALKATVVMSVDGDSGTATPAVHNIDILGGEGITTVGANNDITISGEDATTSNKGIASFAAADFAVSSGAVSLDDDVVSTIDGDSGTATGSSHNIDILGGTGITTAGSGNDITITNTGVTSNVAGDGIDVSGATGAVTISCEDSTAGNKGIVIVAGTAGEITSTYAGGTATLSLTNKTSYWTCPGTNFVATQPETDAVTQNTDGVCDIDSNTNMQAPVFLPHGAVVTACIVTGTGDEVWQLGRRDYTISTGESVMATADFGVEDTSISDATIDNSTYCYFLFTSAMDAADGIRGARITYTTDYI